MLLFQWQAGKKVIVWPEELAPGSGKVCRISDTRDEAC